MHILSERREDVRKLELASEGLDLNGRALELDADGSRATERGLDHCTLVHVYGYTTDERAMRRLPIASANAAVVVADSNANEDSEALGGAELQIADSEALTSTILLRRLRAELSGSGVAGPPLTIVTEFVDLLTRRLFERQPDLIDGAPASAAGAAGARPGESPASPRGGESIRGESSASTQSSQSVVFHRNYIETTALSLATHSSTAWATVQILLNPTNAYSIASVRCQEVFALEPGSAERTHSFNQISDMLTVYGVGLLIGWRRDAGEVSRAHMRGACAAHARARAPRATHAPITRRAHAHTRARGGAAATHAPHTRHTRATHAPDTRHTRARHTRQAYARHARPPPTRYAPASWLAQVIINPPEKGGKQDPWGERDEFVVLRSTDRPGAAH